MGRMALPVAVGVAARTGPSAHSLTSVAAVRGSLSRPREAQSTQQRPPELVQSWTLSDYQERKTACQKGAWCLLSTPTLIHSRVKPAVFALFPPSYLWILLPPRHPRRRRWRACTTKTSPHTVSLSLYNLSRVEQAAVDHQLPSSQRLTVIFPNHPLTASVAYPNRRHRYYRLDHTIWQLFHFPHWECQDHLPLFIVVLRPQRDKPVPLE